MLDKIKQKDLEPYTLICLYIRTLSPEEREAYHIYTDSYDNMRFDSKTINALSQQDLVDWDVVKMKISITEEGKKLAHTLIQEIDERMD